jgi:GNAT superfamily N-acetyltransferase
MDRDRMTIEAGPAEGDVRFLEDQINAYNIRLTGIPFGAVISMFVRDESSAIVAGLYAFAWGGCLDVRYLWVHEDWRGRGHGTRLLTAAETEAVARGCTLAVLDTHSFQARRLYEKLGYEVYGVCDDYPRGFAKYSLKKTMYA